jgi:hypothetical protein
MFRQALSEQGPREATSCLPLFFLPATSRFFTFDCMEESMANFRRLDSEKKLIGICFLRARLYWALRG